MDGNNLAASFTVTSVSQTVFDQKPPNNKFPKTLLNYA